jgi:hypothetical protein
MAKKKNVDILGRVRTRPVCTEPGCTNKARRIGKRQYGDRCHLHIRIYTGQ